ncbi:MAG: hypothetical protein IT342_03910 [Candidatus Melainabacteria bacterium]|nr:hypothetical protein [Candidatus Melainabacteria bacterium]
MKFFELFARSAAGSALAFFLSVVCTVGLTVGVEYIAFLPVLWLAVGTGVVFGLLYSVMHRGLEPEFLSSAWLGCVIAIGVMAALPNLGDRVVPSIGMIVGVLVTGLTMDIGAILSTLIRRRPR